MCLFVKVLLKDHKFVIQLLAKTKRLTNCLQLVCCSGACRRLVDFYFKGFINLGGLYYLLTSWVTFEKREVFQLFDKLLIECCKQGFLLFW